ncbi:uncharacterized protein PHALS_13348 [Plasmopara halstedii]|uniref:Uncharacterized protein n=1 Tax=Plasmopara halstedii TaxID=4781 RepID=A0A0N7L630_PLAHL|nr:uncharacterized protein PHALS_13348 [Plasmopara halstedii]CEG43131.1 hypothetical protein PHALS_13348 [Plasmopara halstedii]|eukprot:XP_024579500.1 hypothetical protein PHALS_13348 [Plasmopara halstedii]
MNASTASFMSTSSAGLRTRSSFSTLSTENQSTFFLDMAIIRFLTLSQELKLPQSALYRANRELINLD